MNLVESLDFYTVATHVHTELVQHLTAGTFSLIQLASQILNKDASKHLVCLHSQHLLSSEKPFLFFLQLYEVKSTHDR